MMKMVTKVKDPDLQDQMRLCLLTSYATSWSVKKELLVKVFADL
jgi:hypothetical protein